MPSCPRCGAYAPPDTRFCPDCGVALASGTLGGGEPRPAAGSEQDTQPGYPPPPSWPGEPVGHVHGADDDRTEGMWFAAPTASIPPPMEYPPVEYPQGYDGAPPPVEPTVMLPGRFDQPGYPPPPPRPSYHPAPRRRRAPFVLVGAAVVLVVVVLVIAGTYALTGNDQQLSGARQPAGATEAAGGPTGDSSDGTASDSAAPSPSTSAAPTTTASRRSSRAQAAAVDRLLDHATEGKSLLITAYAKAVNCSISPGRAERQFHAAAANRHGIVAAARRLDVSGLDGGARLKHLVVATYTTSARADDAFTSWARRGDENGRRCLHETATRRRGNSLSTDAGQLKRRLVKAWNPIAREYGFPRRSESDL